MTTIHAYTADQRLQDMPHQRPSPRTRRGDQPDPGLDRRREGDRARDPGAERQAATDSRCARPVPTGCVVDLTVEADRETSVEEINDAMRAAADRADGRAARVHRGSDRVLRHRQEPGVVDLRLAADGGDGRHDGQGRRPGTTTSGATRTGWSSSCKGCCEDAPRPRRPRREAGAGEGRLQRARSTVRGASADDTRIRGGAADDRGAAAARRAARARLASGAAEGPRAGALAAARRRPARGAARTPTPHARARGRRP